MIKFSIMLKIKFRIKFWIKFRIKLKIKFRIRFRIKFIEFRGVCVVVGWGVCWLIVYFWWEKLHFHRKF